MQTSTLAPAPTKLDFKQLRQKYQQQNNTCIYEIIENDNLEEFHKHINKNKLKQIQDELNISFIDFWEKCRKDSQFARLVSIMLAINAIRQGSLIEFEQINVCKKFATYYGIFIEKLTTVAVRPTKDGKIITNNDMKKLNISKDNCLRSFDARITGKLTGYISAKISYGNGGHQDNVFTELDTLANWWTVYMPISTTPIPPPILILLIDTDLTSKVNTLSKKYENYNNIKILNHYDFQLFIANISNSDKLSI